MPGIPIGLPRTPESLGKKRRRRSQAAMIHGNQQSTVDCLYSSMYFIAEIILKLLSVRYVKLR